MCALFSFWKFATKPTRFDWQQLLNSRRCSIKRRLWERPAKSESVSNFVKYLVRMGCKWGEWGRETFCLLASFEKRCFRSVSLCIFSCPGMSLFCPSCVWQTIIPSSRFFPCCWRPQECHIFMDAADRSASVGQCSWEVLFESAWFEQSHGCKMSNEKKLVVYTLIQVFTTHGDFFYIMISQIIRSIPTKQLVQWNVVKVLNVAKMRKRSQNCCETLGNFS